MIDLQLTYDEAYQFIKLYDILRDMDMPLTPKQMSVFEKCKMHKLFSLSGSMIMTRQGLPTGQMEQETQELLDEYNESYCWEYNDMVDFIKEYGEKKL